MRSRLSLVALVLAVALGAWSASALGAAKKKSAGKKAPASAAAGDDAAKSPKGDTAAPAADAAKSPKGDKGKKGKPGKGDKGTAAPAPPSVAKVTTGLEILCFTKDADIYVDDKLVGKTPMDKPVPLPPGKYTVKVKKAGYSDFIDVVLVKTDEPTPLEVTLLATAGYLSVSASIADAQVTIDGTFAGVAPYEGELLVGSHEVRVTKLCFKDHVQTIDAKAGEEYRLDIAMEELPPALNPCVKKETEGYTPVYKRKWFPFVGGAAVLAVAGGLSFLLIYPCSFMSVSKAFGCGSNAIPTVDLVTR